MDGIEQSEWEKTFKAKRVSHKHSFNMLMCDVTTCDDEQKRLLYQIVFLDYGSVEYWSEYIDYLTNKNDDNRTKIKRLMNLALDSIDQDKYCDDDIYVKLRLKSIQGSSTCRAKYRQMEKEKVGLKSAWFYLDWSTAEWNAKRQKDALQILKKGITANATPREPLQEQMKTYYHEVETKIKNKQQKAATDISQVTESSPSKPSKAGENKGIETHSSSSKRRKVGPIESTRDITEDSVIQIKKLHPKSSSISSADDSSDENTVEETIAEVPIPNPAQKESSSSVSRSELRKKYLDTLPALDLKRSCKVDSVGNSEVESCKPPLTASSASEDTGTTREFSGRLGGSRSEGSTDSSDLDFDTILETDMPKSVPLLQPPPSGKDKDSQERAPSSRGGKKRVSFTGTEEACEPLANLLSGSGNCPQPSRSHSSPSQCIEKKRRDAQSNADNHDSEISIKRRKVSKKTSSGVQKEIKSLSLNGKGYMQLSVLGKGASSTVYRVMDNENCRLYAFKRVEMKNESAEDMQQTIANYSNEINLLEKCKGNPHIINLVDYTINRDEAYIALIMEAGEVDLASALTQQKKLRQQFHLSGVVSPHFLRHVWEAMLRAVDHIHELRIVHGDLKPANFVFVRGELKLIDFGISKGISNDTTNIVRDSLVGTVNYMAPEAVMPTLIPREGEESSAEEEKKRVKYGRASDIWSLGCILYQMLYGFTPFSSIKNLPSKIGAIVNPACEIVYPNTEDKAAVDAIKLCLVRELKKRCSIRGSGGLLEHPLLCPQQTESLSKAYHSVGTNTTKDHLMNFTCSYEKASEAVELVLDKRDAMIRGAITRRELCQQVCTAINSSQVDSKDNSRANTTSAIKRKPLQILPKGLVDQIQLQKSNISNSANSPNADKENPQKAIAHGVVKLKDTKSSDSVKWMRPKKTPEKYDMKSHLEKSLGNMRQFLENEPDDTVETSHLDDFSFF